MLDVAGISAAQTDDSSFWNQTLPSEAVDCLLERNGKHEFDHLILDEAQDLLKESYLDVLDLLVDGGLPYGGWMITGDFSNQSIYSGDYFSHEGRALSPDDFLQEIDAWAPHFPLEKNCRNTPRVAQLIESSARLEPGYSDVLRPDTGIDPDFHDYSEQEEQKEILVDVLETLYDDYYRPRDIVILSPRAPSRSVSAQIQTSPWKERLVEYGSAGGGGYVRYTSIHAFKGLESPVVIITDLDSFSRARNRELFYVAASRSQERLIVFVDENVRKALLQTVLSISSS
jgi:superfamily I DNA/RNA helicase